MNLCVALDSVTSRRKPKLQCWTIFGSMGRRCLAHFCWSARRVNHMWRQLALCVHTPLVFAYDWSLAHSTAFRLSELSVWDKVEHRFAWGRALLEWTFQKTASRLDWVSILGIGIFPTLKVTARFKLYAFDVFFPVFVCAEQVLFKV